MTVKELLNALLSWAVLLSGHPAPKELPEVVFVPHQYMVEHACNRRECRVLGWYAGGREIYLDERLDVQGNLFHSSILVHEMVHYLQRHSGAFQGDFSCANAMTMERQAYAVQAEYLVRYGIYRPVGAAITSASCEEQHAAAHEPNRTAAH